MSADYIMVLHGLRDSNIMNALVTCKQEVGLTGLYSSSPHCYEMIIEVISSGSRNGNILKRW